MDESLISQALLRGPDAIIAADRGGTITFWNSGAERIFGLTSAQALGQSLDLIIPERLRGRHWHGWEAVMDTGHSRYGDGDLLSVPSVRSDGTPLSVEFTIHPLMDEHDELIGIAATLRDATARYEQLRALRKQVSALGAGA
ncbi:MAG: transcriptional regulator [Pseudonocardiales bacterium]|nr:transcriptional regulator [Pseudonocardiales bacterium]